MFIHVKLYKQATFVPLLQILKGRSGKNKQANVAKQSYSPGMHSTFQFLIYISEYAPRYTS